MAEVFISPDDFLLFAEFFYKLTGIRFESDKRYYVDRRLKERIRETGHKSFRSYFIYLKFSKEEQERLISLLTVNETYFFREEYQFSTMVNYMLPEVIKRKRKYDRIRIWSIPCSTGEEPYSVALYLLEYWKDIENWEVEILASDIDQEALKKAKEGIFSARSLQYVPERIKQKYFSLLPNGYYKLSEDIVRAIFFSKVNLVNPRETKPFRNMDIVFCRNLLIYFDEAARRLAAENLYNSLNSGGFLCLGHSESMSRISSLFKVRKFPEAIVYQKPLEEGL
ncbi:MAG: protein-glutamate O-methyltransferase CheR [Thermodesulfobacterium sp.]|nr:protein-glutamate O-methyltransferase CheR [Thermodesulfobacterium sp.]